jgi:hypothetical protein
MGSEAWQDMRGRSFPKAAWLMHNATEVADGGSSDRWNPATQRENTSMASVSQGRWIGLRVTKSSSHPGQADPAAGRA